MGFKQIDLVPLNTTQTSPTSAPAKAVQARIFQVLRTDTTAALKMRLPADATILDFTISGVASDAATTGVMSLGSNSTATQYVNATDVKSAGTFIRPVVVGAGVDQLENIPLGADIDIWAKYAETGTASTVGGPWKVIVYFVR